MAESIKTSSGVQELIERLRDDGVASGRQEAEKIIAEANAKAARMIADAKAQSAEMRQSAATEIEREKSAAMEALKMAARDAVLELHAHVRSSFEQHVRRAVTVEMHEEEFGRRFVLALAGRAREQIEDKDIQLLVSEMLAGQQPDQATRKGWQRSIFGVTREMLREGVELMPASDVHAGARVRLVGEDLEIDLSDRAVADLILAHILPRYRFIMQGTD